MKNVFGLPSSTAANEARAEKVRGDIARRLRHVCRDMSDEDFLALVEKMTQVQLRGELRVL